MHKWVVPDGREGVYPGMVLTLAGVGWGGGGVVGWCGLWLLPNGSQTACCETVMGCDAYPDSNSVAILSPSPAVSYMYL